MAITIQPPYRKQGSQRKGGTCCNIKSSHVVRSAFMLIAVWACILMLQKGSPATVQTQRQISEKNTPNHATYETSAHMAVEQSDRRLGILVGIFTADDIKNDREYRSRHRKLFTLWNDPRVCNLAEFQIRTTTQRASCEVIYTFVVGANVTASTPTEWIPQDETDNGKRPSNPILLPSTVPYNHSSPDLAKNDVTRLNIR
jgi:hypothetical protein